LVVPVPAVFKSVHPELVEGPFDKLRANGGWDLARTASRVDSPGPTQHKPFRRSQIVRPEFGFPIILSLVFRSPCVWFSVRPEPAFRSVLSLVFRSPCACISVRPEPAFPLALSLSKGWSHRCPLFSNPFVLSLFFRSPCVCISVRPEPVEGLVAPVPAVFKSVRAEPGFPFALRLHFRSP
jgi:hypothetical protein